MRYFFLLLKRSRVLLYFLLLESIAFAWIVNKRSYQRSQFLSATTEIKGSFEGLAETTRSYINLKEENELLAKENMQLRESLDESFIFQNFGADTINSITYQQRYTFVDAQVISSSHYKVENYLLINKGELSGLQENMGVIGPGGVVGVISSVSKHFARIIPIINPNLRISAELSRDGYFGPLRWSGENYRESSIQDIPPYANVQIGDTVKTDGRSSYFPRGIAIGYVKSTRLQSDQNFFEVTLNLSTDFSKLHNVYVVKDLWINELDSLNTMP
jgi:rod shape-determining protein MreC